MSKIKILFVIDFFRDPNAGTEGQMLQLIQGLDRSHFEPHLLVFKESSWMLEHGFPCEYSVLGRGSLRSPFTWAQLLVKAIQFKRKGFDIAHIFFNDPSIICPPVFRLVGIRSFISRRDMGYWYTPTLRVVLRLVRYFVDGVIVNSKAVKTVTTSIEGYEQDTVHVIYNGFSGTSGKTTVNNDLGELRDLKQTKRILFAGLVANTRPIKRIDHAIEAISGLKKCTPEVHLVHIGAGNNQHLVELAEAMGVSERVHFLGAREDVSAFMDLFDIGLLCSDSEGFSNAIVEYLWAGLPVVCSKVGGNPEAVIDGFNGYVYAKDDVRGLASALRCLVEDEDHRFELARNAQSNARDRFGLTRMVEAHQRLYADIHNKFFSAHCVPMS